MFLKPNTSVVGPGDPIFYPRQSRRCTTRASSRSSSAGSAATCPPSGRRRDLGYTVGNDVTARDLQRSDGQFTRAKGFDSFCPLGPGSRPSSTRDLRAADLPQRRPVQDGNTTDMIFDVPTLVAYVSSVMTLLPGDVILTGTPEGVGPMQPATRSRSPISGIGTLTNKVVSRD
jgi:2-keto-4-pentenoate hydratase/2-oxohepta-3-ene-1,7-dioic acid hydratase in catechol pathway